MSETEEPKFPEILPVIKEYLEKQQANGEPMRIHLWETAHATDNAHKVVANKELHELVQKYGSPFYVLEEYSSSFVTKIKDQYIYGTPEEASLAAGILDTAIQKVPQFGDFKKIFQYAKADIENKHPNPAHVLFPDPREQDSIPILLSLSDEEKHVTQKNNALVMEEMKKRSDSGEIVTSRIINDIIKPQVYESLTQKEQAIYDSVQKKIMPITVGNEAFDFIEIDKKISGNINSVFKPERDVQLTVYGSAHFTKQHDLNERMPGLSIAISGKDKSEVEDIKKFFTQDPFKEIHNQFPDYVYYPKEKRLIKMDNDAAKAEFLGLNAEQFKAWQLGNKIDEPVKLPFSQMDKQSSIPAPQAHLLPPKTAHKQPSMNA